MRKYGQHFLVNERIIDHIVSAVPPGARNVAEIGPGRGALSEKLLEKDLDSLTLIEIDPEMQKHLLARFPSLEGKIALADFLKFDLAALPQRPTFFVSNLPYIHAAEILDKALSWPYFDGAVFMFQKEQAQRILAREGAPGYGPLSILSQLRAQIRLLLKAGKGSFSPPPKVESAVLTFEKKPAPFALASDWARFARLVKAAFMHRRKTLFNSLVLCGYEKQQVQDALKLAGIQITARAQEVSVQKYLLLNELLTRSKDPS